MGKRSSARVNSGSRTSPQIKFSPTLTQVIILHGVEVHIQGRSYLCRTPMTPLLNSIYFISLQNLRINVLDCIINIEYVYILVCMIIIHHPLVEWQTELEYLWYGKKIQSFFPYFSKLSISQLLFPRIVR